MFPKTLLLLIILRNEPWQPKYTLNGRKLRGYFQYDHHFHGNAPKPHWAMNQVAPTGTRKYHGGASAKPVWCPPKKRQRVSHFIESEKISVPV